MGKRKRRKRRALMRTAERKYANHPRHYLAYGSNHNLSQMGWRCPDAETICRAYLNDWKLVFSGVLTIERAEGYEVPLSVWKVSPLDIQGLDRYEGFPHLYEKMYLDVKTPDGKKHPAFTYLLVPPYGVYPPTISYYRDVETGFHEWQFDIEVLRQARNEAVEAGEYPYQQHYGKLASQVVDAYYTECEVCGKWFPSDEVVRNSDSTYACWECALGERYEHDWEGGPIDYRTKQRTYPHADELWWEDNWRGGGYDA